MDIPTHCSETIRGFFDTQTQLNVMGMCRVKLPEYAGTRAGFDALLPA